MRLSSFTRVILSACTRGAFVSIVTVGACLYSLPAQAHEDSSKSFNLVAKQPFVAERAAKLVNTFWDSVERQDVALYARLIAKKYQVLSIHGVNDRAQQIAGLKALTVKKFKISHLFAAQTKDTLTVSYNFDAVGKDIVSGPNIDMWQRINGRWQLISHSYVPYP
jgi:hypothetical protein